MGEGGWIDMKSHRKKSFLSILYYVYKESGMKICIHKLHLK